MEAASHSDPLVILIDLEKRIRSVSELNELKFVFVNETHGLVPYRQAILFSIEGIPVTFSGVATTERNSPLVQWLKRNISPIIRKTNETRRIAPEDLDPKICFGMGIVDAILRVASTSQLSFRRTPRHTISGT